ncbi:Trafficking protein particle complex subunit 2 protein [Fasciola hepatica]|uniref:Trafficking protein particle complex subunit 2-like protein n=1 Tax=Fasciola hepatica TaxID=6192 RepID=A0A4E0RR34_FASHE|nr:Trafficking protein particle complex subunit 2 protein [Fasciola hepatica]
MAACIAVISDTNQLLYLRTADCPDPLFYHFKVHAALDVIEEKTSKRPSTTAGSEHSEQYLGLLYPMENHRMYGYVTNTKIKFVIIQESQPPPEVTQPPTSPAAGPGSPAPVQSPSALVAPTGTRDTDIRGLFHRLHDAYVDLVRCPFYTCKTPIIPTALPAAARFDQQVASMLAPKASSGICPILSSTSFGVELLTSPPVTPVVMK